MIPNATMIAITEAKHAVADFVEKHPEAEIEDMLRAAFRVTRNHWMQTDEDQRFKAGVGGVLLNVGPETQERINRELATLQALGAAMEGVPVDLGTAFSALGEGKPIGLLGIWRETP